MTDRYADIRAALESGVTGASDPTSNWLCVSGHTVMLNSGRPVWARIAVCGHQPNAAYIAACHPEAIRALLAERDALRDALEALIEKADESDGCQYGTLGTTFVRDIARAALAQEHGGSDAGSQ